MVEAPMIEKKNENSRGSKIDKKYFLKNSIYNRDTINIDKSIISQFR